MQCLKTLKISAIGVSVSSVCVKSRPRIGRGAKNISRTLLEDQRFLTKEEIKEGLFTGNNKPSTNEIFQDQVAKTYNTSR